MPCAINKVIQGQVFILFFIISVTGSEKSYIEGALSIIPRVPIKQAAEKKKRKSLSKTIATYCQSSLT